MEVMRDSKGPLLWEQKILVIRGITSSDSETKGNEGIYAVTKGKRVSGIMKGAFTIMSRILRIMNSEYEKLLEAIIMNNRNE